jgi:hypothetical protein
MKKTAAIHTPNIAVDANLLPTDVTLTCLAAGLAAPLYGKVTVVRLR